MGKQMDLMWDASAFTGRKHDAISACNPMIRVIRGKKSVVP